MRITWFIPQAAKSPLLRDGTAGPMGFLSTCDQKAKLTKVTIVRARAAEHVYATLFHASHLAVRHPGDSALKARICRA